MEIRRFEEVLDAEGGVLEPRRSEWDCEKCGKVVISDFGDAECRCGAQYNAFGQRLRDDWRGNSSTWDDEMGDLEGYELQHAGDDW